MPRTYSFDHFQAKKPQQSVFGSPDRLGNPEDKMKPLKHELPEQGSELPGAGEIHYGREHAETVKRFQARHAARKKAEASTRKRTARKTAPRKATAPKQAKAPKTAAPKQAKAPKTAAAKVATPAPARAVAPRAPAREPASSRPGILSWPIRKVASGVKRLASRAVAPMRGRAKSKGPTKRR